jgi:hypothetical protein
MFEKSDYSTTTVTVDSGLYNTEYGNLKFGHKKKNKKRLNVVPISKVYTRSDPSMALSDGKKIKSLIV